MQYVGERFIFYAGRDNCRLLDANILFIVRDRSKPPTRHGEMVASLFHFSASWDWLPTIQRVNGGPACAYDSSRWTGRRYEIVGWSWPFTCSL